MSSLSSPPFTAPPSGSSDGTRVGHSSYRGIRWVRSVRMSERGELTHKGRMSPVARVGVAGGQGESEVLVNRSGQGIWVSQKYLNETWRIDPQRKVVTALYLEWEGPGMRWYTHMHIHSNRLEWSACGMEGGQPWAAPPLSPPPAPSPSTHHSLCHAPPSLTQVSRTHKSTVNMA